MLKRILLVSSICFWFLSLQAMGDKYLENTSLLSASPEFVNYLNNQIDAPESYDFLCRHVIKCCPQDMEKRFDSMISHMGWGTGKILNLLTSKIGLNKLMVDGMLQHREPVTNIFAKSCNKQMPSTSDILKIKLDEELRLQKQQKDSLLMGVGRIATGKLLACIYANQSKIPEIIIKEMVEKKSESNDDKDQKEKKKSYPVLSCIVKKILEKCTSEAEEWKKSFGAMTVKAYQESETTLKLK